MPGLKQVFEAMLVCVLGLAGQNARGAERVDQILAAWEARTSQLESLTAKCQRTNAAALGGKKTVFVGDLAFLKPDLTRIDFTRADEVNKKDEDKTTLERLIFSGERLYEYSAKYRSVSAWKKVPEEQRRKTGVAFVDRFAKDTFTLMDAIEDDFYFLKGMKLEKFQSRYEVKLTKETEWYAYLYFKPKKGANEIRFTSAQLTLWLKNPNEIGQPDVSLMPVRLWLRLHGGGETTYEFSDIRPNAKLDRELFEPKLISGYWWKKD